MKDFLNKVLLFFLILLLVVSGVFGITFLLSYRNVSNIKLDDHIHMIICGDSRTKTAFNDSIIPNALNIAHSSEHYLYTYNVLKLLLRNNPQLKTVVLGFSFHNLASFYDDYLFEKDKSQYMYPRYFSVLDSKSIGFLLANNFDGFIGEFKGIYQSVHRHISAGELDRYSFIGEYYDSDRKNKTDSTIKLAIQNHYYNEEYEMQSFSGYQLTYIEMIMKLCQDEGVTLILVNCPVSKEYQAQIPSAFIDHFYQMAEERGFPLFDFHDFEVPEECYGDGDHLNKTGSILFSQYIMDQINILSINVND